MEKEADYVDEEILKIGKRKESGETIVDGVVGILDFLPDKLPPLATPEERVAFVRKYFPGVDVQQEVLEKYQKSSETSRQLLNRGTELYKLKNFPGALHYYNLALLFAEKGTQSVGFAYANRSAVLVELGHFEEALEDIELAVKNNYSKSQVEKLVRRKNKCEKRIQTKQVEYLEIDPKVRNEMEDEIQRMKYMRDGMFQVEKPNSFIPGAADFVEIKYDTVRGRQLFVNRDIQPGTLILVEKPYVCTLYGQSKWDTEHCHNCFQRIWSGIPCEYCVFAIYCGEFCRKKASKIHKYECKCLPFFHAMDAAPEVLMAVRIILKVGERELFRLFETKDPQYFSPTVPFGTEPNCVYNSQSYLSVFHLVTNSDKLDTLSRVERAATAIIAATILESRSDLFENIPSNRKLEFKQFVAALMTRHLDAEIVNAAALMEIRGLENVSFVDSFAGKIPQYKLCEIMERLRSHTFAKGIYPLFSLMSHSCDPNVSILHHSSDGTMMVMASRALKRGELLLPSYHGDFTMLRRAERQAELTRLYNFKCDCIACEQDWPTMNERSGRGSLLCCPICSKRFFEYEKATAEFKKCVLTPSGKCGSCGRGYETSHIWMFRTRADEIARLLQLNRPFKALELFPKVFDFFQHHICPPFYRLYSVQHQFQIITALIIHYAR